MVKYETKIVRLGSEAEMFKSENMMILFGHEAPADLADYSYIINVNPLDGEIKPGMVLTIDEISYKITAVGNIVNKNLNDLGHITLRFNGASEAELPGTLYLEAKEMPSVTEGTSLKIQ